MSVCECPLGQSRGVTLRFILFWCDCSHHGYIPLDHHQSPEIKTYNQFVWLVLSDRSGRQCCASLQSSRDELPNVPWFKGGDKECQTAFHLPITELPANPFQIHLTNQHDHNVWIPFPSPHLTFPSPWRCSEQLDSGDSSMLFILKCEITSVNWLYTVYHKYCTGIPVYYPDVQRPCQPRLLSSHIQ